jgi:hypothetical protein
MYVNRRRTAKAIASAVQLRIGASCGSVFGVVASMVEDGGGVTD